MFRTRRTRVTITCVALLAVLPASGGCLRGYLTSDALTVNINVPLGLNGFGGILNPFGIITALINAFIGSTFAGSGQGAQAQGSSSPGALVLPPDSTGGTTNIVAS